MKIHIPAFTGIAPAINRRDLPDTGAYQADNLRRTGSVLEPMYGLSGEAVGNVEYPVEQVHFDGDYPRAIYLFGQTLDGFTPTWFSWPHPHADESSDIDVCRTQIFGDSHEWTFWTGEVYNGIDRMRGTYVGMHVAAGSQTPYPNGSFEMGLAAPTVPLNAGSVVPDVTEPAKLRIAEASSWYESIYAADGTDKHLLSFTLSANGARSGHIYGGLPGEDAADQTVVDTTRDHVYADGLANLVVYLNANYDVDATYDDTTDVLTLETTARGADVTLQFTWGQLSSTAYLDFGDLLSDFPLTNNRPSVDHFYDYFISEGSLSAFGTDGNPGLPETRVYTYTRLYRSESGYEIESAPAPIGDRSTVDVYPVYNSLNPPPDDGSLVGTGHSAMREVWLDDFFPHDAPGTTPEPDVWNAATALSFQRGQYGIRLYRSTAGEYLLVDEFFYEPDGSLASRTNDAGETILQPAVNDLDSPYFRPGVSEGGTGEHAQGVYAPEQPIYNYIDRKQAADLAVTVLPSLTWSQPPEGMRGLINLPNGMMAGYKGRDLFFCEPYSPHAWPLQYSHTLDYPIVALARLDTTLVVLTEGFPYLVQGSHPEVMTVVQGQLPQACVSKRSVVSMGGAVLYTSPDGLCEISPQGGRVVTEGLMRRTDWRSLCKPERVHAYQHESQYVAFLSEGQGAVVSGRGFVYDPVNASLIRHNYTQVHAGYTDLDSGQLYVAGMDGKVWRWGERQAVDDDSTDSFSLFQPLEWQSKSFVLPYETSFAWAQVAAEDYQAGDRMRFRLIVDGYYVSFPGSGSYFELTSRLPFRLPPIVGREVSVALENVRTTVFSVTLAQSGHELVNT